MSRCKAKFTIAATASLTAGLAEEYDPDLGVDRTGGTNDIGIQHAGIEADRPIFHVEPPIE